jgi:solute carrier family 25 carnitine/acylcarnitine transporter 20/29
MVDDTGEWRSVLADLAAGTVGGCSGIVVGYPLDTVRVRLMSTVTRARYIGVLHCFSDMVRTQGVRGEAEGA